MDNDQTKYDEHGRMIRRADGSTDGLNWGALHTQSSLKADRPVAAEAGIDPVQEAAAEAAHDNMEGNADDDVVQLGEDGKPIKDEDGDGTEDDDATKLTKLPPINPDDYTKDELIALARVHEAEFTTAMTKAEIAKAIEEATAE